MILKCFMYLHIQLQHIFVVQKQIKHINTAYLIKIDYLLKKKMRAIIIHSC